MKRKLSKLLGIALTIALLTSLLVTAAPAAALSAPTVSFAPFHNEISKTGVNMTIIFTLGKQLSANASVQDDITITLPAGYTVANGAITGTVAGGVGWFNGTQAQSTLGTLAAANLTGSAMNKTIKLVITPGEIVGEAAQVRIGILTGVDNPDTIDDYTLTVKTSKETVAVTSEPFSIVAPYVAPEPGVTKAYNSADVLLDTWSGAGALQAAINRANKVGCYVEVGPGTYVENPVLGTGGVTIKATGTAEETVVKGSWTTGVAGVDAFFSPVDTVIQGFTLQPATAGLTVITTTSTANNTVIKDCVIKKAAVMVPNSQVGGTIIKIGTANSTDHKATVTGCSIDVTDGAVADKAIQIMDGPVTITGCTFELDAMATLPFTGDVAVEVTGANVTTVDAITIENSTFNGNSGTGYEATTTAANTTATITSNTFTGLSKAIYMNCAAAGLTLKSNTITGSTTAPGSVAGKATATIDLANNSMVVIQKNTIQDNNGHTVQVGVGNANVAKISFSGNVMSGNAFGVINKNLNTPLTAELNYWGDNSGPTTVTNPGGVGDPVVAAVPAQYGAVDYTPWSNTSTTEVEAGQAVAANGIIDKSTTVGIAYASDAARAGISLMRYSANPAPNAPPGTALADAYYDVYSPNAVGSKVTLMFYNPNITADTKVYYYSALQKEWVKCDPQGIAGNKAYAYVTLQAGVGVVPSTPIPAELNGTVFTLVNEKTIPNAAAISSPTVGAYEISTQPMFTWAAVPGAIRYEIALSEDPTFTIIEWAYNVDNPFYKEDEALRYDTTYYWRVRAILNEAGAATPWTTGIFTTESAPEAAPEPITVEPTKPEVNVEIPPTKITVEPAETQAIPNYMLWIIIAVGAVLIIALIVLIVRTRRVV
jgi:hypothetical protein